MDISSGIPKKITPDFLFDTVVELRFSSSLGNATVSELLKTLLIDYPIVGSRTMLDNNQAQIAHIVVRNDNFTLSVGSKSIVFSSNGPYQGWNHFNNEIEKVLSDILKKNRRTIEKIDRIGLRFLNFFEKKTISEAIDSQNLQLTSKVFNENQLNGLHIVSESAPYKSQLRIAGNVKMDDKKDGPDGSVVDIDVYFDNQISFEVKEVLRIISEIHEREKVIFFSLLGVDLSKSLKIEY